MDVCIVLRISITCCTDVFIDEYNLPQICNILSSPSLSSTSVDICSDGAAISSIIRVMMSSLVDGKRFVGCEWMRLDIGSSRRHVVDDDRNNLSYHHFGEMIPRLQSDILNCLTRSILLSCRVWCVLEINERLIFFCTILFLFRVILSYLHINVAVASSIVSEGKLVDWCIAVWALGYKRN